MLLKSNALGRKLPRPVYGAILLSLLWQGSWAMAVPSQWQQKTGWARSQMQPPAGTNLKVQQTLKVKRDNLKVQLTQCIRAEASVVCTLLLSSLKEKVPVWVTDPNRKRSRLIDVEGNEYSSFEILEFGKSEANLLFVNQTPVKLVLSFTDLPAQLANIALLEIGLETYGHEVPIQFRQVSLSNGPAIAVQPEPTEIPDGNAAPE